MAALTALAGKVRLARQIEGVLRAGRRACTLRPEDQEKRLGKSMPHLFEDAQRLFQKREAFGSSPQQRGGVAQTRPSCPRQGRQVPFASHCQPAFQQADRVAHLSPGDGDRRDTSTRSTRL